MVTNKPKQGCNNDGVLKVMPGPDPNGRPFKLFRSVCRECGNDYDEWRKLNGNQNPDWEELTLWVIKVKGERAIIRERELEQEIQTAKDQIIQQDNQIKKLNQNVDVLSGEVKRLTEQLTYEKMKTPNIPKKLKKIFTSDLQILKKYKDKPSELLNEFKNNKDSQSIISHHLEDFMIKGEISIGCSDNYLLWPDVLDYVTIICDAEKLVSDKIEKQVKEGNEDLSGWNDGNGTVKLSLVFNMFGLSSEIIQKFKNVNGSDFDVDMFSVCSSHGIDDWNTILDLGYIQMMLRSGALPCKKHLENCPVCCCSTPKDLENLFKEHKLVFDFDLLERNNINGPRFMAINNTRWIQLGGEKIDEKAFRKVFQTMKKLHETDDF